MLKMVCTIIIALASGVFCSIYFDAPWNAPVHYLNIIFGFIVFPGYVFAMNFTAKSRNRDVFYTALIVLLGYTGGWWAIDFFYSGQIFIEVVIFVPILLGFSCAMVLVKDTINIARYIRSKFHSNPDTSIFAQLAFYVAFIPLSMPLFLFIGYLAHCEILYDTKSGLHYLIRGGIIAFLTSLIPFVLFFTEIPNKIIMMLS